MSDRAGRQDQIKSTPEQLFCTLKAADAGAWDWDLSEDKVLWPAETFMQFGLDPEKGIPHFKEWLEQCVHPEDRERLTQYCKTALAGHESAFKIEYRIIHPEHRVRWLAARGSIERDESCQPVRVRGLNIDITEQKEIEEKLRKSEERLALALKASSTGVWEWDCVTDKVTWSKECYDIHGLKSFGGTREAFARLVYPEDAERLWATFNSALANRTEYIAEFRIIRGDSEVRWVANSGIATYDMDGRPLRVLGTITDIHDRKLAEIRLAEREKQLTLFVENSPAAVAMFDTEMRYVTVSRRFMTERRLEGDLTGRSHYELFPNLPQDWLEAHRRVLNGEEMAADEDYFERPDGTSDWTRWSMKPWRREDGSIGGALLMTETVTAQVEARRRLAESEAKFRAAFENAAVGVAQTSPSGKFKLFNKRFLEFTGYSEAELLAKGFQDITHPDDLPAQEALMRGVLEGSTDSYALEKRYIRKDGSIAWITLTVGCVRKPDGAVDSFIGVINDITERKKTEAALRESKDLLHYCLKVASAGVWDWNIPSGAVTWSPENYKLYGRDPSDGPLSQ